MTFERRYEAKRYERCLRTRASMVFVSLFPPLRRCVLLAIGVGLIAAPSFAQRPAFLMVGSTPYDNQMARVSPILASVPSYAPGSVSMMVVNQWMSELRAMPYQYSRYWQTPDEMNWAQAGDCKGKALALYEKMRRNGARNVRVVIGKHHIYDSATHAWVEWETAEGGYMLDPTFNETPIKTAEIYPMTYIPSYAYDGMHKYRVANTGFGIPSARVATGYRDHLNVAAAPAATFAQSGLTGIGSRQFFHAPTEEPPFNVQRQPMDTERSWSDERSWPSPSQNGLVTKFRHVSARAGLNRGEHATSSGVKRLHVRSIAHHKKHLIRTQRRRLVSSP